MFILISQIVGAVAFIIFIISIQQKSKSKILFYQTIAFFYMRYSIY